MLLAGLFTMSGCGSDEKDDDDSGKVKSERKNDEDDDDDDDKESSKTSNKKTSTKTDKNSSDEDSKTTSSSTKNDSKSSTTSSSETEKSTTKTEKNIDGVVTSANYGQKVNYSVTVKDGVQVAEGTEGAVTLDDWEIFLKDGDYVYMMYGDYLPNAAISSEAKAGGSLSTEGTYKVWSTADRTALISSMTTTSYWEHLITSNLQKAAKRVGNAAVATGGATAGQFKQSWNDQYPNQVTISGDDTSGWSWQSLSIYAGYRSVAEANNLYFPHKSTVYDEGSCYGYWLASPSSSSTYSVMNVNYDACLNSYDYDKTALVFRPLVRLPSSILEQNTDGVTWDIKY